MLSYKLGSLKAAKEFAKQANLPTSTVLKLAPQILNAANIERAKALINSKAGKRLAPSLLGLETANIVSRAHADQLSKAKAALSNLSSPTTINEILERQAKDLAALKQLNKELGDNPGLENIIKLKFEQSLQPAIPNINTSILDYIHNKGVGKLLEESVLANPISGLRAIFNL
jgi:hypothetical protein